MLGALGKEEKKVILKKTSQALKENINRHTRKYRKAFTLVAETLKVGHQVFIRGYKQTTTMWPHLYSGLNQ